MESQLPKELHAAVAELLDIKINSPEVKLIPRLAEPLFGGQHRGYPRGDRKPARREGAGLGGAGCAVSRGDRTGCTYTTGLVDKPPPGGYNVVIDDPVSSLDSGVLFLVSSLVRELIEICYNNVNLDTHTFKGNEIEQIYILTHNTYFHREITYNQTGRFDFVSFFLVQKRSNVSTVRLCVKENKSFVPPRLENYNPVQNSYKALWSELTELSGAITTMSVIRRILEYYFLQLCGYEGTNLRKEVLEKNQHRFIVKSGDESVPDDDSKFHLAQSMLSYIGKQDHGFNDGIDYVDESTDVHEALEVFRIIFDCLDQIQHYNMMMEEVTSNGVNS